MTDSASVRGFEENRARLTRLAYQLTGSIAEAEDIVQDAYLRWEATDDEVLRSPGAWLTTVVTRLCFDAHKSARARRETYIGPWLPEPVVTSPESSPFDHAELAESLSMALLRLLERLSATERAAFVLREAFEYTYDEIGEILGKKPPACRQLVRRARQQLTRERPRYEASVTEHTEILDRFITASQTGEVEPLLQVLAEGVTLWSDGGGKVLAARNPIHGSDNVARFLVGVRDMQPPGQSYALQEVNGRPAIVGYVEGRPRFTTSLDVRDGRIHGILIVMNPDKLSGVPPEVPPESSGR